MLQYVGAAGETVEHAESRRPRRPGYAMPARPTRIPRGEALLRRCSVSESGWISCRGWTGSSSGVRCQWPTSTSRFSL